MMRRERIYFLGIGGIGMSALARYFMGEGLPVAGYDRTPTPLTAKLEREGAQVHFEEDAALIPQAFRDPATTLVVYTPAVPQDHAEMEWFRRHGFEMMKRSEILGVVAEGRYVMAVAGTHGKTTVTTLTAWLNHRAAAGTSCAEGAAETGGAASAADATETGDAAKTAQSDCAAADAAKTGGVRSFSGLGCGGEGGGSAFLGGISNNFASNIVTDRGRRLAVEADEFDRSFLRLHPDAAVITSADADHLDIYGTPQALREAFEQFIRQIKPGGSLILHRGVDLRTDNPEITVYGYAYDAPGDFHARNVRLLEGGYYRFDIVCPDMVLEDCTLGVPGRINIENAVAAVALMWVAGFDAERLKQALADFRGVKRRFEFWVNTPRRVYMDDYAHHPEELAAAISSVRDMFPGRRLTAVFQPHLYTRTRDFHAEFARALSMADEVVLIPVYPAREQPIEGVDSALIARDVTVPCRLVAKEKLVEEIGGMDTDVLATFGAGDIDALCEGVARAVEAKV